MPDWASYVRKNLRLRAVRPEREAEIIEDLARQLDDAYRDGLRHGASESDARAQAEAHISDWSALGGELSASPRNQLRQLEQWHQTSTDSAATRARFSYLAALKQDLIYGLRVLRKSPGFMLTAVLILALGIGANTAIFSVVNAVLLRPLPFSQPDQLVRVMHVPPAKSFPGVSVFSVSPANFLDWCAQNHSFEDMAAYRPVSFVLKGGTQTEPVRAIALSPSFFSLLRVNPDLGRAFIADDDEPGHGNVVLLSHSFWQSHFGSDPNVIGQTVRLSDAPYVIVGVMPARLEFPSWFPTAAQIWVPLAWSQKERAVRGNHNYSSMARLRPGVSAAQAQAEMDTISKNLAKAYPEDDTGWGAVVQPLHSYLVSRVRPALLILLGAVAFVLLIACANVANLVLAKTLGRSKEMAIRAALGANRGRLLQQILVETILLAVAGGAAGLFLARYGTLLIARFLGDNLPRATEIRTDGWVLAFTLAVAVLTGIIAG